MPLAEADAGEGRTAARRKGAAMSKRRWPRQLVDCDVLHEEAVIHSTAFRNGSGGLSVEVRVTGVVKIDGDEYEFNRVCTMAVKRSHTAAQPEPIGRKARR
jgi:hypothetical protein